MARLLLLLKRRKVAKLEIKKARLELAELAIKRQRDRQAAEKARRLPVLLSVLRTRWATTS